MSADGGKHVRTLDKFSDVVPFYVDGGTPASLLSTVSPAALADPKWWFRVSVALGTCFVLFGAVWTVFLVRFVVSAVEPVSARRRQIPLGLRTPAPPFTPETAIERGKGSF